MRTVERHLIPAATTALMHVALLALLWFGIEMATPPKQVVRPNFVEAKLVKLKDQTKSQHAQTPQPKVKPKAPKQEAAKQEQKVEPPAPPAPPEPPPPIDPKVVEQAKQAELKKQLDAKQALQVKQEQQKKQQEAERKKLDQQKKLQALKKKQEVERKKREEEAFEEALAEERDSMEDSSETAQSYMSAIQRRVIENWSRPPSAVNGMQCVLLISLVPTGRVVDVQILKSSGNSAFDYAAVQAVKKVEQFDEVKQMPPELFEQYYREFELDFNPQDLRR